MPTGAIDAPRAKMESAAGAEPGARYRTAIVPAPPVVPLCEPLPPDVDPSDSSVPAEGAPRKKVTAAPGARFPKRSRAVAETFATPPAASESDAGEIESEAAVSAL